jgi:signal peptidase I
VNSRSHRACAMQTLSALGGGARDPGVVSPGADRCVCDRLEAEHLSVESRPMLTTLLLCLVVGGIWLIELLCSAWLLRLGARWARVAGLSMTRAVLTVLLMGAAGLIVRVLVLYGVQFATQRHPESYGYAGPILALVLSLVATWGVVQEGLRTTLGKAILAWLPTLLAWAMMWAVGQAVVRPFLFEGYVQPTNAMAPTILGRHGIGTCPSCGGTVYISPDYLADRLSGEELGICGRCKRASTVAATDERVVSGDRLISAKFLRPRRWDLIVFRNPEDPSTLFVKRVVGLPGEQVAIQDGDVWINGARAQKPADIAGLVYVAHPTEEEKLTWGPVPLGQGEYLVLGDFSRRAKDSRVWETGAPGHPAYAVPESYILGVVTHIYWPLGRWRIFR